MADLDKIVIEFKERRTTPRTHLFDEVIGEQEFSDKGYAVGPLYIQIQALELIGTPKKIRVTIEPIVE